MVEENGQEDAASEETIDELLGCEIDLIIREDWDDHLDTKCFFKFKENFDG